MPEAPQQKHFQKQALTLQTLQWWQKKDLIDVVFVISIVVWALFMKTSTNTCQNSNLDPSFSLGNNNKKIVCLFFLWLFPGTFQASQLFLISKQYFLLQEVLNEAAFRIANEYEHHVLE